MPLLGLTWFHRALFRAAPPLLASACPFTLLRWATFSLPTQGKGRKKLVCSPFRRTLKIPTPVAIAPLGIFILQGKTGRASRQNQERESTVSGSRSDFSGQSLSLGRWHLWLAVGCTLGSRHVQPVLRILQAVLLALAFLPVSSRPPFQLYL